MNIRKIAVPLPFVIAVQKTSRHKLSEATYFVMVDISVATYDDIEAPIAAHYSKFAAPDGIDHVRTTGDGFYKPVFYEPIELNPFRRMPPVFMSEAIFLQKLSQADGQDYSLFPKDTTFISADYRKGELAEFNSDHVFNYDKAALSTKISTMQEAASSLALIDGFLYQRSPEPYYKVTGPSGDDVEPYISVVTDGQSKDKSATNEFSLSNFDEASDYAERIFGQSLPRDRAANVLIPTVFELDRTKEAVLELLDKALDVHAPDLAFADLTTMFAWGHLRDAVQRAIRSDDPAVTDEVFSKYAEPYTQSPQARQRAAFYLKHAQERWSMRPIQSLSGKTTGLK